MTEGERRRGKRRKKKSRAGKGQEKRRPPTPVFVTSYTTGICSKVSVERVNK